MSKSIVLLASTTVVFGIALIYLAQALRNEHERADVLQARLTTLEQAAPVAQPASQNDTSLPSTVPTVAPSANAQPQATTVVAKKRVPDDARVSKRLTNKTYQAAQLAYARLELEYRYSDLAETLNLQPREAERLFDLLARQSESQREYEWKRDEQGGASNPAAFRARQQEEEERRKAAEAERAALLGDAKLAELNQYLNSMGARSEVRELRTRLAESSYPLRSDQIAPMVAALAAEQQRHTAERQKLYNSGRDPMNPTFEEVIVHTGKRFDLIEQSLERRRQIASTYLDSEQQKRYAEMLGREQKRAQIDYDLFVTLNKEAAARTGR